MKKIIPLSVFSPFLAIASLHAGTGFDPARYNVSWNTPGEGPQDSMPLGNGDITVNAWTLKDGSISLLIGKSDTYDQNGRLLKVGGINLRPGRIPDLPAEGNFEQTLHLEDATLRVRLGSGTDAIRIALRVDANQPLIHAELEGEQPFTVDATLELWRNESATLPSLEVADVWNKHPSPPPTVVPADVVLDAGPGRIGWYHANPGSVAVPMTMKHQGLSYDEKRDPLLNRVFGAMVSHPTAKSPDGKSLSAPSAKRHEFNISVHTAWPSSPSAWKSETSALLERSAKTGSDSALAAHREYWSGFWQRSWIEVTRAAPVSPVPTNPLPFGFLQDAKGGNQSQVRSARAALWAEALDHQQILVLSRIPREKPATLGKKPLWSASNPKAAMLEHSAGWTFPGGMTAAGWFRAPIGNTGRLFDKISLGGTDGVLFDLQNSRPRLICGSHTLISPEAIPADQWTHLAAVISSGEMSLFINGKLAASSSLPEIDEAFLVSQSYQLQRFITACAGKGRYPIRFNGSTFTIPHPGKPGGPDYRRWGNGYWWQNTRLPYFALSTSGDHELMPSLFRMYVEDVLPASEERTRLYSGLPGAFIPECVYPWGAVFSEAYGWKPFSERGGDFASRIQSGLWHKWEWTSTPELLWLMLDHYEHTLDEDFLRKTLIPTARTLLSFFDARFGDGPDGKMRMEPSMALETWRDTTNPAPDVAGITAVCRRLLGLAPGDADAALWRRLLSRMPGLSVRETEDGPALAPASRYETHRNVENPELYPVFPFRLITSRSPDAEKKLAVNALKHRWHRGHKGWRQDELFMAYLGLAGETRAGLLERSSSKDPGQRFPAFWAPNYDWTPDQTHGGVLMRTLQAMVLQTDGKTIDLLPALPEGWKVSFRLHAPHKTVVEGRHLNDGKFSWKVTPPERRADVLPGVER